MKPPPGTDDLGPCPFCGLAVFANAEECTVYHAIPTCAQFDILDAMDFVTQMRMTLERKRGVA